MTITECFKTSLHQNTLLDNEFGIIYEQLLIKLIPEKACEETLIYLFNEYTKNAADWFYNFHKSIRQSDFFGHDALYSMVYDVKIITNEEIKKRKELLTLRNNKRLEWGEAYSRTRFNTEYPNETKEIDELNAKFHNSEAKPIAGNLDVILHAMISSYGGFLKKAMENCFEDYKHFQNKKEKGLI